MTKASRERLQFLLETVEKERRHLLLTTQSLFSEDINVSWVASLEERPDVAERLDAFVARFGRLQDTLGDKLIPALPLTLTGIDPPLLTETDPPRFAGIVIG
jgi:hypothetical protein